MSRSFTVLLAVAGVLVLLVLVFANPFQDSIRKDNPPAVELFDPARLDKADRVTIRPPTGASTVLARKDGNWVVASEGDFPADTAAVGSILRAVRGAHSSGTASTNPGNRGLFEVDSTGVRVTVAAGGEPAADFTVGKSGRDFTTSYVLPAGSDAVLEVRGINRNLFTRPRGFRDATLFRFEPAQAAEVTLSGPDGPHWRLARGDSAWTVTGPSGGPETADERTVDQVLRSLSTLSGDGFVDHPDTVDTGLEAPALTATVRLMNDEERTVRFGNKNDHNQRYASRSDRDAVYLVGQWRVDAFDKKAKDLAGAPGGAKAGAGAGG